MSARNLEKLKKLKEMNISYNLFSGFVSKDLAKLDTLNMMMFNNEGVAVVLQVKEVNKNSALASGE